MDRRFVPLVLLIVGCCASICAAAEAGPTGQHAPELRVQVAGVQKMGDASGYALAVKVSNPNQHGLWYHGYRPDSFDPPIPKGQMYPIYRVELKQDEEWKQHPIGWCGTGMDELELAANDSATFGVWVPAGTWDAVRIGVPWYPDGTQKDSKPTIAWSSELTRQEIRRGLPPISLTAIAHDPQRPTTFYTLRRDDGDQVVSLLRSMFIVVNPAQPYATFEFAEAQPVDSLIVVASAEHQMQVARVLRLVDPPENPPETSVEGGASEPLVMAYPIRHTDGDAAATILRSLFLVVNHQVAYARFGYDPRTRSLIAIGSNAHQKQIAKVLESLDVQPGEKAEGEESGREQPVHLYAIRYVDGEQLVVKLRSQFVVVNHEKAEVRFGFDAKAARLIVITADSLQAKISAAIAALDAEP